MELLDNLRPEVILLQGGLSILVFIVFLESGCFGFFLPGDSLLFTAGLLCSTGVFPVAVDMLITSLIVAGIAGYFIGYYIGRFFGAMFRANEGNLIKRNHLEATEAFYRKYGITAIIIGRFIPIVRTFAPVLAGMVSAPLLRFMIYNVLGSIIWVLLLVGAGFWFGNVYPGIADHLELVIIGIVIISVLPALNSIRKKYQKAA